MRRRSADTSSSCSTVIVGSNPTRHSTFDIRLPDILSNQLIILRPKVPRWSDNDKGENMEIVYGLHDLVIVLVLTCMVLLPRAVAAYFAFRAVSEHHRRVQFPEFPELFDF